jgi:hypothetical protein
MQATTERTIYGLLDPRTNAVLYVGVSKNPTAHLRQLAGNDHANKKMRRWIKELAQHKLTPLILVIEVATANNWRSRERYHVRRLKPLFNNQTRDSVIVAGEKFLRWLEAEGAASVAERLKLTRQAVEAWLRGDTVPSERRVYQICELANGALTRKDVLTVSNGEASHE